MLNYHGMKNDAGPKIESTKNEKWRNNREILQLVIYRNIDYLVN